MLACQFQEFALSFCFWVHEEFIKDKWYVSPENRASWYRARWDGEWMGFYRLEEDELQSFYNSDDLILSRAGQK
jgi:hypothetical protein